MAKYFIEANKKYGEYTTIEEVVYTNPSGTTEKRWKCQKDNGDIHFIRGRILGQKVDMLSIKAEQNEILEKNNLHQIGLRNRYYSEYKDNAKKRNYPFNISFEEFNTMIIQDCYYCGSEPSISEGLNKRRDKNQPLLKTNGVDRIDSNIGYEIDNCVTCCSMCNKMKNTYTTEEFLNHIYKIHNFQERSTTRSEDRTLQANGSGNGELPEMEDDIV